jgi:hypothetical protein
LKNSQNKNLCTILHKKKWWAESPSPGTSHWPLILILTKVLILLGTCGSYVKASYLQSWDCEDCVEG